MLDAAGEAGLELALFDLFEASDAALCEPGDLDFLDPERLDPTDCDLFECSEPADSERCDATDADPDRLRLPDLAAGDLLRDL